MICNQDWKVRLEHITHDSVSHQFEPAAVPLRENMFIFTLTRHHHHHRHSPFLVISMVKIRNNFISPCAIRLVNSPRKLIHQKEASTVQCSSHPVQLTSYTSTAKIAIHSRNVHYTGVYGSSQWYTNNTSYSETQPNQRKATDLSWKANGKWRNCKSTKSCYKLQEEWVF